MAEEDWKKVKETKTEIRWERKKPNMFGKNKIKVCEKGTVWRTEVEGYGSLDSRYKNNAIKLAKEFMEGN